MTHKVKFYIDPLISTGYNDLVLTNWLNTIINCCNTTFSRNKVNVTFQLDGYDATTWQCPLRTGSEEETGGLILSDFPIYIELRKGGGGSAIWSKDGGTVLAGIRCFGISTTETEMAFWDLIFVIIHEYIHARGKVGEFYYYPQMKDYTKVDPIAPDISISKENDPYWGSRRANYINDPMTMTIGPSAMVFAPLHVYYLNNLTLRKQPSLKKYIKVNVKTKIGNPISNATCQVWYQLITGSVQNVYKDAEGTTNVVGTFNFNYDNDDPDEFIDRDPSYRIIKVKADGFKSKAVYLTLVDIEEQQIMKGYNNTEITVIMEEGQSEPTIPPEEEQITVAISKPQNGESLIAPAGIMFQSVATSNQSVTKVEYFNGANSIGSSTVSPYTLSSSFNAGNYSFTAKATGKSGKVVASNPVNITVTPKPTDPSEDPTTPIDTTEIKLLKESIVALKNSINVLNSKVDGIVNGSVGINIKLNK